MGRFAEGVRDIRKGRCENVVMLASRSETDEEGEDALWMLDDTAAGDDGLAADSGFIF